MCQDAQSGHDPKALIDQEGNTILLQSDNDQAQDQLRKHASQEGKYGGQEAPAAQASRALADISISAASLSGTDGFTFQGQSDRSKAGRAVITCDVNGDGYADVLVGATDGLGLVYVLFGKASGWPAKISAGSSTLNGASGFKLIGRYNDGKFGYAMACGDVNSDGIMDMIVGVPLSGAVDVFFGKKSGWSAEVSAAALDGNNGFEIQSDAVMGSSVASCDVNGDGIADIIISSTLVTTHTHVIFGRRSAWAAAVDVSSLVPTNNGFTISFEESYGGLDLQVYSVTCGDVNGDLYSDVIIGSTLSTGGSRTSSPRGEVHVVYGKPGSLLDTTFSTSDLDGSNGFKIFGRSDDISAGWSLAVGDINGDGCHDIIIGAPDVPRVLINDNQIADAGELAVVFGRSAPRPATIVWSMQNEDYLVLLGKGSRERIGVSLATADINGDGKQDIIFGAPFSGATYGNVVGRVYVLYGREGFATSWFSLSYSPLSWAAQEGFTINGQIIYGEAGFAVAAGDVNGDGRPDIVIGEPRGIDYSNIMSPKAYPGTVYVAFGPKVRLMFYMHTYIYTYIYICMYVCIHTRIYIYPPGTCSGRFG
jgi:hypothetical protein